MNTDKVKIFIKSLIGKEVSIKVNLGRNKEDKYNGIIDKMYDNIFTVRDNNIIKSYSYSDILIKKVSINIIGKR